MVEGRKEEISSRERNTSAFFVDTTDVMKVSNTGTTRRRRREEPYIISTRERAAGVEHS